MKKLFIFGNEFLEQDKLASLVADKLKGNFQIVHCRSPDELMEEKGEIIILDVIKGVKEPVIIKDISQLKTNKMLSLHDFDLGFFLNLMKKMGIKKKIRIIGIPEKGNIAKTAKEVKACI